MFSLRRLDEVETDRKYRDTGGERDEPQPVAHAEQDDEDAHGGEQIMQHGLTPSDSV